MRVLGFLPALFAGSLGIAILAAPAICPTCAERISSRLSYTRDFPVVREAAPQEEANPPVAGYRAEPPPASALALAMPEDNAAPTLTTTAVISPAPGRVPDSAPAATAAKTTTDVGNPPATSEGLSDKGSPQAKIAAATVEGESKTPLPPASDTMLPSKDITSVEPEEPALRRSAQHEHGSIKQHRAKARTRANKYSQVPLWAAKMFETNWQDKAFAYQYASPAPAQARTWRHGNRA